MASTGSATGICSTACQSSSTTIVET